MNVSGTNQALCKGLGLGMAALCPGDVVRPFTESDIGAKDAESLDHCILSPLPDFADELDGSVTHPPPGFADDVEAIRCASVRPPAASSVGNVDDFAH